jgi:hypothetical protein
MAANIFEFPVINPLRPVWQALRMPSDAASVRYKTYNPAYNYKQDGDDFLYNSLKSWEDRVGFCQPFQQSDTVRLQWFGSDATDTNYTAELLKADGTVYTLKTISVVEQSGTWAGQTLYSLTMSCWDIPEGKYFVRLRYNHGSSVFSYIVFEPIHIKQVHPNTIRLNYKNSYNDQSVVYFTELPLGATTTYFEFEYQLRVNAAITEILPSSKFTVYEDQPLNAELVSGVRYREYTLQFGITGRGITEWLADKLEGVFLCDILSADGHSYTRMEGSKLEREGSTPLSKYSIKLRDRYNLDTNNYNLNIISLGTLPTTDIFWVEAMTINSAAKNIRKRFNGKRNFIDYLNCEQVPIAAKGYFSENNKGELIFVANDDVNTLSGTWVLSIVLPYAFKFRLNGAGDFEFEIEETTTGTSYYAVDYGDGTVTNRDSYTTQAVSKTYTSTGEKELCIFVDRCKDIYDTATTINIVGIGGNLPPTIETYTITSSALGIRKMDNNMFTHLGGADLEMTLDLQNLNTDSVDEIIRHAYESRNQFGGSSEIDISGNTPAARPTSDLGNAILLGTIRGFINLFTTD